MNNAYYSLQKKEEIYIELDIVKQLLKAFTQRELVYYNQIKSTNYKGEPIVHYYS